MDEIDTKILLNSETRQGSEFFCNLTRRNEDHENKWWTSESTSSTRSYSPDTDSFTADWEAEISSSGEVFYIESYADFIVINETSETENQFQSSQFTRRKSTRAGKFMRFINQRESNQSKGLKNISPKNEKSANKNKSSSVKHFLNNKIYDVSLTVDPEKKQNLGRRASKCEAYLGIIPGISSDGSKVVVNGFVPQGEAIKFQCIREGDYLCRINSKDITFENLNSVLSNMSFSSNVQLEFQRNVVSNTSDTFSTINSPKQSTLVRQIVGQNKCNSYKDILPQNYLGIMFLDAANLTEVVPESQVVKYAFPRIEGKMEETLLFLTKGAFVTLNHLMTDILGPRSARSTILSGNEEVYISYTVRDDNLLLLSLSKSCCDKYQATELSTDIIRMLEFTYGNLSQCFTSIENHSVLDHLFFLIYQRIELKKSPAENSNDSWNDYFETVLPAAQLIRLPKEAHIQIDSVLNEMEAMDYRDWNEDPMNCQRLYTIIGSCLYHKSYLLGSHLPYGNLIQVNSFLRQYGLLNLITNESLKTLIVWKKVYPSFVNEKLVEITKEYTSGQSQFFLLIVGFRHDLLAVLFESGGCTAKIEDNVGPNAFYVEEAQETLQHIQKIGIPTLAAKWILVNTMMKVLNQEQSTIIPVTRIADNLFGFIKSSEMQNCSDKTNLISPCRKMQEVFGTKRHNNEDNAMASGSVYSSQTSDDSHSQGTGVVSEISDEAAPILGRRAIREKINVTLKYSEDSDSDFEMYRSEKTGNSMDIAVIRSSLLCEAEYISPQILTVGERNYLIYYLHLNLCEGILISSTFDKYTIRTSEIIIKFSRCIKMIRRLLQNALRYKKILNQDTNKYEINKSLMSIREQGTLFTWNNLIYWVVGKMFPYPHAKEFYVCYHDSTPQNLIEMLFRLNSIN